MASAIYVRHEVWMMRLFYSPGACSLAPHIILREVEQAFDLERVDFTTKKTETGRDFNSVNSKGCVPALELAGGEILTETSAILQYIADSNNSADVAPRAGTLERARLQEHLSFISAELQKAFDPLFTADASREVKTAAPLNVARKLDHIQTIMADGRRYLLGNTFSVADAYLFVVSSWTKPTRIDLGSWPDVAAFVECVGARPSVIAAKHAEGRG
jgi:glutathione S-transferase